jgi:Putative zincin peptidase
MPSPHPPSHSGVVVALMTFPGVIVHEFAHKLFCQWTGTKVLEVCYLRYGDPVGYVIHEVPKNIWKHILIDIGPFFINTFLGFVLGVFLKLLSDSEYVNTSSVASVFSMFLMWLAGSIAMHAFPSVGDAASIWQAIWQEASPISAKILGATLVGFIVIGAIGSIFWLHAIYAILVIFILPLLVMENWSS